MNNTIDEITWDFLIIGAGPSGSSAAISLAAQGKSVLLIDKSSFPRDKVCGCCLNEKSLKLLDSLGVFNKLMVQVSSKLENLSLTIANKNFDISLSGQGFAVSRVLLDQLLITKAIKNCATFLPSTKAKINTHLDNAKFRSIQIEGMNNVEIKSRFIILATGLSNPKIFNDPEETQADFIENAILKGKVYASENKGIAISDDSGLEVDYLKKLPGVHSARFSDCEFDLDKGTIVSHSSSDLSRSLMDKNNNDLLLRLMQGVPKEKRTARFISVIVVVDTEGKVLFSARGESEGYIAEEVRGENGFGYDPIFEGISTSGLTYAEISPELKNKLSHRGKALAQFKLWCASLKH